MLFITKYRQGNILHTEPKQLHNQPFSILSKVFHTMKSKLSIAQLQLSVLVRGKHLMVLHLNNHIVKTLLLTCKESTECNK